MALALIVALIAALIVFDIFAVTIGVDSRDWENETLRDRLHVSQ